jgi:hypothetical protein
MLHRKAQWRSIFEPTVLGWSATTPSVVMNDGMISIS